MTERRKVIVQPKSDLADEAPSLNKLVNDALNIIAAELAHYRRKTSKGITLDLKEARVVQAHMKALVDMSREARESQKPEILENLSDEELLEIAKRQIEAAKQTPSITTNDE